MNPYEALLDYIRSCYPERQRIGLHEPIFQGNERAYVLDTINSTFVSSVGAYVDRLETMLCDTTGAQHAVATVNGTTALHMALLLAGVSPGDLVITQAVSFVATANAIAHAGAVPTFLDINENTLGLDPEALEDFLASACEMTADGTRHKLSGKRVAACVPMHTFGHPCSIEGLLEICNRYGVPLVEDAAEALGSLRSGKHCGTFGLMGTLSFNGNKIVTCGGGGAILTNDPALARRAKHLTTTAKVPHAYRFIHDEVGYNYRLPNLNAALACAQLEQLDTFIADKRALAAAYAAFCDQRGIPFMREPRDCRANYWLNAVLTPDAASRNTLLEKSNMQGIQTRPIWDILADLPVFSAAPRGNLSTARRIAERIVNIPSGVRAANRTGNA